MASSRPLSRANGNATPPVPLVSACAALVFPRRTSSPMPPRRSTRCSGGGVGGSRQPLGLQWGGPPLTVLFCSLGVFGPGIFGSPVAEDLLVKAVLKAEYVAAYTVTPAAWAATASWAIAFSLPRSRDSESSSSTQRDVGRCRKHWSDSAR